MKKSKIFILTLIFVTVMLAPFGVQASGNLTVTTDVFSGKCVVTASFFGTANEPVSVEIVPAGTETSNFSDLLYALQTAVYFNQTNSDESGTATFEFPLKKTGEYTVRVHSMNNRGNSAQKDINIISFEDASDVWYGLTFNPSDNLPLLLEILGVKDEMLLDMSADIDLLEKIENYDISSFSRENADAFIIKLKSDCKDIILLRDVLFRIEKVDNVSLVKSIVSNEENAKVLGITEYMERYNSLGNTKIADSAVAGKVFTKSEFIEAFVAGIEDAERAEEEAQIKPAPSRPSSGGGGGGGSLGGTAVAPVVQTPPSQAPSPSASHPFTDISGVEWATEAIASLYNKGIINGKSADKFDPDNNITREEFVKIAICVMGIEPADGVSDFADVDSSAWYAPFVNAAVSAGIVGGYSDEVFGVGDFVTRQDVAVILDRIGKISASGNAVSFSDSADISDYASDAVGRLSAAGVINGSDGKFMPKSNCTRAQAACMVYRMMSLMEGK